MLKNFTSAEKIYIATGYTDLRRGIDGLAGIIQSEFEYKCYPITDPLPPKMLSKI